MLYLISNAAPAAFNSSDDIVRRIYRYADGDVVRIRKLRDKFP